MTLSASTIPTSPYSVQIVIDGLNSSSSLTSTWAGKIDVPTQAAIWFITGTSDNMGTWWPHRTTHEQTGVDLWTTSTRWGRSRLGAEVADLLRPSWVRGQVTNLGQPGSWLTYFNGVFLDLATKSQHPGTANPLPDLIASEMPAYSSLADAARILQDFQIGLANGRLVDLTRGSGTTRAIVPETWTEEADHADHATRRISCQYTIAGAPPREYTEGSDTNLPALHVAEPVQTLHDAIVEVGLQRLRLLAGGHRAAASLPLDLAWQVGDVASYEGTDWVALRVSHRTSGDARPDMTELTLRPTIPAPAFSAIPDDPF